MRLAVVLLSGGLDSATTLAWALRDGFEAHALTIRYGQRHGIEVDRATDQARRLGAASHRIVDLDLSFLAGSALTDRTVPVPKGRSREGASVRLPATYVPARNTIFLALAVAWAEVLGARDVFIGVNAVDYSGYPDCRPDFLEALRHVARLGTGAGDAGAEFRFHAPLIGLTKREIVLAAVDLGVDLARTVSCYDPGETGEPCGSCDACVLRKKGFDEAGMTDPARVS